MLIAKVLWLGLAVLPWALGLSVRVIYLGHSGFSVKKREKNVGEEKAQDKSESIPFNLAAFLKLGQGASASTIDEEQQQSTSQDTRPLLASGARPKCGRRPVWKQTAMVFMCVLAFAAFAAVAPAVAVAT